MRDNVIDAAGMINGLQFRSDVWSDRCGHSISTLWLGRGVCHHGQHVLDRIYPEALCNVLDLGTRAVGRTPFPAACFISCLVYNGLPCTPVYFRLRHLQKRVAPPVWEPTGPSLGR